jgi:hypothetical protein
MGARRLKSSTMKRIITLGVGIGIGVDQDYTPIVRSIE